MKLPNLAKELDFRFTQKPLLVGGMAMEYYGLRKSGKDVDFVISKNDHKRLIAHLKKQGLVSIKGNHKQGYKKIPELVDLWGDKGILVQQFEIWNQIRKSDYKFLSEDAINKKAIKIISLEKLLYLKALAMDKPKYAKDLKLIVKKILKQKYS